MWYLPSLQKPFPQLTIRRARIHQCHVHRDPQLGWERRHKNTWQSQKSKLKANMESKAGQFICSAFLLITWVHWFEKSMIIVERSKWALLSKVEQQWDCGNTDIVSSLSLLIPTITRICMHIYIYCVCVSCSNPQTNRKITSYQKILCLSFWCHYSYCYYLLQYYTIYI